MGTAFLQGIHTYVAEIITYTWDKYYAIAYGEAPLAAGAGIYVVWGAWVYSASYVFNGVTGAYSIADGTTVTSSTSTDSFTDINVFDGSNVYWSQYWVRNETGKFVAYAQRRMSQSITPTQGPAMNQSVQSTDISAYPANGEKNGYWYVRRA